MELPFDLWHLAFANLIQRRAPPNFEVQSEVRLTIEPQRADLLLLRRIGVERKDSNALVLRRLWPRLGRVTVLEYKSPVDSAFRLGDLLRLVGYGVLYHTAHLDELPEREDLTLVLVVASVTPTLLGEIERMGSMLAPLEGGYACIAGLMYTTHVVVIDEVTDAERDEYLRLFSHKPALPGEATLWLRQWMKETKMKQPDIEELPGFEELFAKSIAKAIQEMPLEERLSGLAPEQRLSGLAPEQVVLALPLEILRALPEEYLGSLPAEIQEQVRKRLQETTH
ncbi:MAG: hypothetical protein HUU21_37220 [Polyangiaceae bacterium]|nr:hypothetical protein [Polyangiaceae bacterium]